MSRVRYALRRWWWRRFHPLVRIGYFVSTAGARRPATQTIVGISLMAAGLILRTSSKRKPAYTHRLESGQDVRIRVLMGDDVLRDTTVRT